MALLMSFPLPSRLLLPMMTPNRVLEFPILLPDSTLDPNSTLSLPALLLWPLRKLQLDQ